MIFLGWNQPLLPAATDWLLASGNLPGTSDLAGVVVVVRGRRAGRRFLEFLALKCSEAGTILVPPEILTPSGIVRRLTQRQSGEPELANTLACALAWAEAIGNSDPAQRQKLFRRPGANETGLALGVSLNLGRHLHQVWNEIGGAGLSFGDVIRVLGERFPHIADFEIPRWEILRDLHQRAGEILQNRGLIDPTDYLVKKARQGIPISERKVILVGVAEMPRVAAEFLRRLPHPPIPLIFAPESDRDGFDELGMLKADYWSNKSSLAAGQIHPVERDRDQALRTASIVKSWHDAGLAPDQITVAIPDPKALPRLREALETEQFRVRAPEGRPVSDAPAFQFLRQVAAYLDHSENEPPAFDAVAALVRNPDFPGVGPEMWPGFDRFATNHFPARFDPESVAEASEDALRIQQILRRVIDLDVVEIAPKEMADWTFHFLTRIYGECSEHANSPEGRLAVQGLKLLGNVLLETGDNKLPWAARVRPADFLSVLLDFLGDEPVPEPAAANAVQMVGWLELIEDDTPAVVVTSFYEGAVPESVTGDPFLPGSLRQALSVSDNAARFARDAYALAAVVGSRADGRGSVALVAPRFDSEENPTRPSRLLLAGLEGEILARRVWHLSGRRPPEPQLPIAGGDGFAAAPVGVHPPVEKVPVTAFRTYIESPRKFYYEHVLRLRSENDSATELDGGDVGTLIHEVLSAFGADSNVRDASDAAVISQFIHARFDQLARERFGRWAQPAVEIQIEEVRRRLGGFVRCQAELRQNGWEIRYVEGTARLECELPADAPPGRIRIAGKIDRIDYHAGENRWRIIDYKTSAKAKEPLREHRKKSGEWRDLQLPLYLKLAAPHALVQWSATLTPENCELNYFFLPEKEGAAGISEAFPAEMVEDAWSEASMLAGKILRGEFDDNPILRGDLHWNDPALLALCGQVGIASTEPASTEIEA